jgi:hypothetical protein
MFVTLCEKRKTVTFWNLATCNQIGNVNLTIYGNYTDLGLSGFDIIQNGKNYNIFFTVTETVPLSVNVTASSDPRSL